MKIIDLLNKIANGEIPKKIKVSNKFTYIHDGIDYKSGDGTYLFDSYIETTTEDMNIEIEIIEDTPKEKKIPEKLDLILDEQFTNDELQAYIYETQEKVNQVIDYLKSKGE